MSAANAATSATTAITTGRGTRLVVAAMVFTFVLSASGGRSLLRLPGAGANTRREKCLHRDRPQVGVAYDRLSGGTQSHGCAVDRRSRYRHNTRSSRGDDDRLVVAGPCNHDSNGGMTSWQGQAKRGVPAQPGPAGRVDRHRSRTGEPIVRIETFHGYTEARVIPRSDQGEVPSLSYRLSAGDDDPSGRAVEEKLLTHRIRPEPERSLIIDVEPPRSPVELLGVRPEENDSADRGVAKRQQHCRPHVVPGGLHQEDVLAAGQVDPIRRGA